MQKNIPQLWLGHFHFPKAEENKYDRGHVVIAGGGITSAGATKLAARAALRAGAGLVSVACDAQALPIYAASFQAVMTKPVDTGADFSALIADKRVSAALIGPGFGMSEKTRDYVHRILTLKKPAVLDADALSVFSENPAELFAAINYPSNEKCIITPHEGEFARLFPPSICGNADREKRARLAAKLSGAVVILKGNKTIIAAPDGKAAINENATPYLATAGSGDALAGICVSLLAQSIPAFEAACAGVWLHAEAGARFGAGLIAEDIEKLLPGIISGLQKS